MKITNLDPSKYKRFFAFGCSFTNYKWATWADIIGHDIEFYENWGKPGGGNHFIFNSVIEANARHNFKKGDLVIVFWSTKEREDRYLNNKWLHDTVSTIENTYGKEWVSKFYLDTRSQLIRDLGYMSAVQTILNSSKSDWGNLVWYEFFNSAQLRDTLSKKSTDKQAMLKMWREISKDVYTGGAVSEVFDDRDVIKLYQSVFENISGVYKWFEAENIKNRSVPDNDNHPTPTEALMFLDWVWPENILSNSARDYAYCQDLTQALTRPEIIRL